MKNYRYRIIGLLFVVTAILSILAACESATLTETDPPGSSLTPSPIESLTEPPPVVTPTQTKATVILLTTPDADPFVVSQVKDSLEKLTDESGLELVIREDTSIELSNNVSAVVAVGESIDLYNFAASYPGVSFVAVNNANAVPSDNVSVIGDPVVDQQHRSFIAGYLAALISEDYKVAALAPAGMESTEETLESFVIGMRFFCGICQTKYPPYQTYPQWETFPVGSSAETFQLILDNFENMGVEVIFIHSDLISPQIMTLISDLNMKVVGDRRPDTIRNNYAGTIISDPTPALESIWRDILDGNNGFMKPASIVLVDRNPDIVSEGRYRLFSEMVEDLQSGLVYPEAVP